MEITERQLRHMVADVDDRHRAGMAAFALEQREAVRDAVRTPSRRRFLRDAGLGGLAVTVGSALLPIGRLVAPVGAQSTPSEADIARFAASLEYAAVAAYQAAADTGKISRPVLDVATTFAGHHQDHGDAFASFVGEDVPANQTVLDTFGPQIAQAADEAALLEIAFGVENAAAATYLFALGVLENPDAVGAVASILPVEAQHAVVLGQALGKDLTDGGMVPSFETTDAALDPADFPISA